jgi:hypothetical protein
LISYNVDGPKYDLEVSGKQTVVSAYVKILKSLRKKGAVFIKEKEIPRYQRTKPLRCSLPSALIEKIWESLPPLPWPRDLHKTIPNDFSISNKQAHAALSMFLQATEQVDGDKKGAQPSK